MQRIPLSQGKFALVDDADFERLAAFKWHLDAQGYAARNIHLESGARTIITMHRAVIDTPSGTEIDHVNRDGLDNRRANLRICDRSENIRNRVKTSAPTSSIFKGVCWAKSRGKWVAHITVRQQQIHLGVFADECDAALAYNAAAITLHGEFARLNSII